MTAHQASAQNSSFEHSKIQCPEPRVDKRSALHFSIAKHASRLPRILERPSVFCGGRPTMSSVVSLAFTQSRSALFQGQEFLESTYVAIILYHSRAPLTCPSRRLATCPRPHPSPPLAVSTDAIAPPR